MLCGALGRYPSGLCCAFVHESATLHLHQHMSPAVPEIQNRRRAPQSEEKDGAMRDEVPTHVDMKMGLHNEPARDASVAPLSTKVGGARVDYPVRAQRGDSKGNRGAPFSSRGRYKG